MSEHERRLVSVASALSDAIRELGSVPAGTLYAAMVGTIDRALYESAVRLLKGARLVSESNHVLTWVGPTGATL